MELVSRRASSKEALIGLLEVQECLTPQLSNWDEDDDENNAGGRFCALLDLYSEGKLAIGQTSSTNAINAVIPRITLRKKGPLDTLRPIMKGIAQCIGLSSSKLSRTTGRSLLQSLATLISGVSSWITSTPSQEQTESDACNVISNDLMLIRAEHFILGSSNDITPQWCSIAEQTRPITSGGKVYRGKLSTQVPAHGSDAGVLG
jgi:hypothetical protein